MTKPETTAEQIDRLATFITENIPGEPSQSQGAVDTAIRLLETSACCDDGKCDWVTRHEQPTAREFDRTGAKRD